METIGLVNEAYRKEVDSVLNDLIEERRNIRYFVKMHDDGERAAQEAEAGPLGLTEPPIGSKFNADAAPTEQQIKFEQTQKELVNSLTKTVESMAAKLADAEAKLSEYEAERERKRIKRESFTVKELLQDLNLIVPTKHMNRFGSDIKKKFDEKCPGSSTFLKHGAVAFRSEDRVLLESLVKCAHREFELWTLSAEPVCANAGLEGEALEEVLSGAAVNEDYIFCQSI